MALFFGVRIVFHHTERHHAIRGVYEHVRAPADVFQPLDQVGDRFGIQHRQHLGNAVRIRDGQGVIQIARGQRLVDRTFEVAQFTDLLLRGLIGCHLDGMLHRFIQLVLLAHQIFPSVPIHTHLVLLSMHASARLCRKRA